MLRIAQRFLVLFALMTLAGCGSYRLGEPNLSGPVRRLRLGLLVNKSFAPQFEAQLRSDLLTLFEKKPGRVRLEEPADTLVEITITDYKRIASVKQENHGLVPRAFTLEATAECALTALGAEAPLFKKPKKIQACIEVVRDNQALQAEYESMPQLSLELAIKIHKALVENYL